MSNKFRRKKITPDGEQTLLYDKITKLEIEIVNQISQTKKAKKMIECQDALVHQSCQNYDLRINYYDKFWKGYMLNCICRTKLTHVTDHVDKLSKKVELIRELIKEREDLLKYFSLTKASKAEEAAREGREAREANYECKKCSKSYVTAMALATHTRLKHQKEEEHENNIESEIIQDFELFINEVFLANDDHDYFGEYHAV